MLEKSEGDILYYVHERVSEVRSHLPCPCEKYLKSAKLSPYDFERRDAPEVT
jgi:hypothetical protein